MLYMNSVEYACISSQIFSDNVFECALYEQSYKEAYAALAKHWRHYPSWHHSLFVQSVAVPIRTSALYPLPILTAHLLSCRGIVEVCIITYWSTLSSAPH